MSYSILAIPSFRKELNHLVKKYPSLKNEIEGIFESLKQEPTQGTAIGKSCFKIRISITSKGKGKSGGARIITHVAVTDTTVFLLTIYDKSEKATLSAKELAELLQYIEE